MKYILVASCPDRIGIVHAVSDFFFLLGATIIEAAQYTDESNQRFFMRWKFGPGTQDLPLMKSLKGSFSTLANTFGMDWEMYDTQAAPKILLAVSKYGHCLNDLLHRWKEEKFPGEIVGVVSNHQKFQSKVESYGLPYYHLPVNPANKQEQEKRLLEIMEEKQVELLVLARYMQILSDNLCAQVAGRAINIHHSFLPSFKGAKPYHQAFERGVKIIGATAHYVTKDLDEGPIIEQDVQRIEHFHGTSYMVDQGKNIETVVLARAVMWHCQRRILLNGNKTVIFR
ncbi:MAG: formyltetrahydrofolate deformylase [Bacteroidota bacterium]